MENKSLKEVREGLGYSQLAVESITGISQSTISRIELGLKKTARIKLLENAIIDRLLTYEGEKNEQQV